MKPATSVLLLTTLTGGGYGLLAWLGILTTIGVAPSAPALGTVTILIALTLASAGLIASMAHLGRPERAWRAFSQWRSSWLSREAVASVLCYPPAILFGIFWWLWGTSAPATRIFAILAAIMALTTVGCTAMIYGSLKPIRQWHNSHTLLDYLIFALFSGAALLTAITAIGHARASLPGLIAILTGILASLAKLAYWHHIDHARPLTTLASAVGVTTLGQVRPLDQPHFTENYILREMGFQIARKHSRKLRRIALAGGFILPVLLLVTATSGLATICLAPLATALTFAGLYVERWLFFAEATHVSAIYYGRDV